MSRYSLKQALRATRGARTSACAAERRYGRDSLVAARIRKAIEACNRAERALLDALRARRAKSVTRRAAA